jgi:hypothetical protein
MVRVSNHGNKRIRSRCGVPKKSVARIAKMAFDQGIRHCETTGALNKYITAQYFYNETANNIRIYADKVYIFSGEILVTVLELPHRFRRAAAKIMQQKKNADNGGIAI